MSARRILYVPWNRKQAVSVAKMTYSGTPGFEFLEKNNKWITEYKAKQLKIEKIADRKEILQVWYSKDSDGNVTTSTLLAGLGQEDQVYIRGHCVSGRATINTEAPINTGFAERSYGITYDQDAQCLNAGLVVSRLQASGLLRTFQGKIKCYNCHSCEPLEGPNFALALFAELRKQGFKHCRILGYVGSLESFHDSDSTNYRTDGRKPDHHKHSAEESKDLGRASANRYIVVSHEGEPRLVKDVGEGD